MESIIYNDYRKDLPQDQLHHLFILVGWSDGSQFRVASWHRKTYCRFL